MKKLIYFIGLFFLTLILILNIVFTANLDSSEHIEIKWNNFYHIIGLIITGIVIYIGTNVIETKINKSLNAKSKKFLYIFLLVLYFLLNVIWCIAIRPAIVADQIHVCNLAQTFYRGNDEEFLPNITYAGIPLIEYMQAYTQQITLAFVFSIFFKIIHFDGIGILRILNILGNVFSAIALLKINNQLNKNYKTNKFMLFFFISTFFSLTMLSTFIYGDIPSIALCLFNVYFMMKYVEKNKISYFIYASIFTMIAYMMRMNSLIFIIATVMYLLFSLFNEFKTNSVKKNIIKIVIILIYIIISIIPSNLVKTYYINKYNLDNDKAYPSISFFLMAMEESPRANGWYSESIGEPALKNPIDKKVEYVNTIKERLLYFKDNLDYAFKFYIMKIASMWTENSYSAIHNNGVEYVSIDNLNKPLLFYQKSVLILVCVCCLITLFQQRKNLSLELIFLITIFIGGFAFHILWEAKSRYILPYIVVLFPIACINIKKIKMNKLYKKVKNYYHF